MNRHNAMLIAVSVCTLSLFTFVYTYYGTKKNKATPVGTENVTIITATTTSTPTAIPKKEKNNPQAALEAQLATALEQHDQLLAENKSLLNELKMLNGGNALKKTYFVSMLNEKSFQNSKQEIAFVKKEVRMLKRENSQIRKEIKKLQKKK